MATPESATAEVPAVAAWLDDQAEAGASRSQTSVAARATISEMTKAAPIVPTGQSCMAWAIFPTAAPEGSASREAPPAAGGVPALKALQADASHPRVLHLLDVPPVNEVRELDPQRGPPSPVGTRAAYSRATHSGPAASGQASIAVWSRKRRIRGVPPGR